MDPATYNPTGIGQVLRPAWADMQMPWSDAPGTWDQAGSRSRSVLPPNATAQERDLEDAAWRLTDVYDLASVQDPTSIPAPLLPWLAWAMSVDVWIPTEPEDVKRKSIMQSALLHRIKGTLQGFRMLTQLFGASVEGVQRPPNKFFCGATRTQAQKDASLAVFPQLRIRTRPLAGVRETGSIFFAGNFFGAGFPHQSDAAQRLIPQAYYYDQGVETELATFEPALEGSSFVRVCQGAVRKYATFAGSFLRFSSDCDAAARVFSFTTTYEAATGASYRTLVPALNPIEVFPEFVAQQSTRHGLFAGPRHGGSYIGQPLALSTAAHRLYSRIYLFDPTRKLEAYGKTTYMSVMRLGQEPYTAELEVLWQDKRSPLALGRFMRGFTVATNRDLYNSYLTALAWGKSARDQLLLDTRAYEPIVAGEQYLAGGYVAGQMVRRF